MYRVDVLTCLRTNFQEKGSIYFLHVVSRIFSINLPLVLQIRLRAQEKYDHLFMSMLSDLFNPISQLLERFETIDGEDQEDCGDALIECSDHGFKQFLSCLFSVKITVSQICNLTCF